MSTRENIRLIARTPLLFLVVASNLIHSSVFLLEFFLKNYNLFQVENSRHSRLRANKGPAPPPLGNFADISYLEENFKPHLLRDVCTLCSGALVSDSLFHMLL